MVGKRCFSDRGGKSWSSNCERTNFVLESEDPSTKSFVPTKIPEFPSATVHQASEYQPRNLHSTNNKENIEREMFTLVVGGGSFSFLLGCAVAGPAGGICFAIFGAVFIPSLLIPMFWPVYFVIFLFLLTLTR